MTLLLVSVALLVGSGLATVLAGRAALAVSALGALSGCVLGLVPAILVLAGGPPPSLRVGWPLPGAGVSLEIDALSAFFLVPVFALGGLAAVYGASYLKGDTRRRTRCAGLLAFHLLLAAMVVVVTARNGVLFLCAWEIMSLAAWVLVSLEHEAAEGRRAGWVFLVAGHVGALALVALFLLLARQLGTTDFLGARLGSGPSREVLFALALVGFGLKAGLVPLHVWLPEAHAAAPSHVSAVMSGVMIKMGVYGILRVVLLAGEPSAWWGPALMGLGLAGALVGIGFAAYQRDLKRTLAYSSVENVGLIMLGLGLGLWGLSSGRPDLGAIGFAGGLLHVWNHAAMKGLMFFTAGSVVHGTGTRDLERMGGLMKRMPRTGKLMVVGAVGIAALPPMNGFVSESLLYLGLIRSGLTSVGAGAVWPLLAVGLLAMVGCIAALCFVRLVGIALLGEARHEASRHAHESGAGMTGPMAALALACGALAVAPILMRAPLGEVMDSLAGAPLATDLVASFLRVVGTANAVILLGLAAGGALVARTLRGLPCAAATTWGCGYLSPTPRMQYTARSFGEVLAEGVLPRVFRGKATIQLPAGPFPTGGDYASICEDPVTRDVYEPFFRRWATRCMRLRLLQQGELSIYLLYIVVAVVAGLSWTTLRDWGGGR